MQQTLLLIGLLFTPILLAAVPPSPEEITGFSELVEKVDSLLKKRPDLHCSDISIYFDVDDTLIMDPKRISGKGYFSYFAPEATPTTQDVKPSLKKLSECGADLRIVTSRPPRFEVPTFAQLRTVEIVQYFKKEQTLFVGPSGNKAEKIMESLNGILPKVLFFVDNDPGFHEAFAESGIGQHTELYQVLFVLPGNE